MATQATGLASWRNLNEALGSDCLRISTYNIHRCIGTDRREDTSRVARVIAELNCDTIGLQEVDNQPDRRHDSMQLDFLAHAASMTAIPGHTIVRHEGEFGNALLTRRPVLGVRQHDLSFNRREPRGALHAELRPRLVLRRAVRADHHRRRCRTSAVEPYPRSTGPKRL